MPSIQHEILVELFRNRPRMAAEFLAEVFDVKIPVYEEAAITSENVTELQPAEYRADLVVKLLQKGSVVFVIVVEVQLSIDPNKRFTWPPYVTVTREEYRCPVDLLILAPDPVVAKWCEEPIPIGVRRFVLEPPVLHGNRIPKVKDPGEATERPELALLSALAHGDSDEVIDIGRAALEGFSSLDPKLAGFYSDILYNAINEAARRALEVKMKDYVFTSPFAVELIQQGVKQGRDEGIRLAANSLIKMLRVRELDVSEQTRQRILAERDIQRIELWLERAVTAKTLNDVFESSTRTNGGFHS